MDRIEMDRQEIMEEVASYFAVRAEKDGFGNYDIDDCDWASGCYVGRDTWLSLGEVVRFVESRLCC